MCPVLLLTFVSSMAHATYLFLFLLLSYLYSNFVQWLASALTCAKVITVELSGHALMILMFTWSIFSHGSEA